MADLIDRQTAIETAIEAADKWDGGYSSEREGIIRKFFDKVPAVQPDHVADISKKAEGDCISRQAAIDAVIDEFKRSPTPAIRAKLRLEALPPAQPGQRWIPCSERLPEYNESVLTWDGYIFCIEKRIPYMRDDDGEPIEGDWWVDDEYDEYESEFYPNLRDGAAIAWMPLPEPYEGGETE